MSKRLASLRAELERRESSQGISHDVAKMNKLRREIAAIESRKERRTCSTGITTIKANG